MMLRLLVIIVGLSLLSACGGGGFDIRETLGVKNTAPDESTVVSTNPLSVPPDFNLRPPHPGAPRPQELDSSQAAKNILMGTNSADTQAQSPVVDSELATPVEPVTSQPLSTDAEQAFKDKLNLTQADPNVKETLTEEQLPVLETDKKKQGFWSQFFGQKKDAKKEPVIDASQEKKRIDQNKQEGKPVNEGDVKKKEQKEPSTLQRIFDIF